MSEPYRIGKRPLRSWAGFVCASAAIWFLVVDNITPPAGQLGSGDETRRSSRVLLRFSQPVTELAPEIAQEEEEEPVPTPESGQVVDIPEPTEQERPEEAEYLAEYDNNVDVESRSVNFRVNPEVLADVYSEEAQLQEQDIPDLDQTEPSSGAIVGNNRFDPDEHGEMAALPSPYAQTNLDGLEQPAPGGSRVAQLAGSPGNDLVQEENSDALRLKTQTLPGAGYINRIKRLVSYYWSQNLDNLPDSVIFAKPQYTTVVDVVLDGNGAVETVTVQLASGSAPLDNAVLKAFEVAGPFPNPPSQLIGEDGRVSLSDMHWTVELGQAAAPYMGVDPRAGVQFPGILKAPR